MDKKEPPEKTMTLTSTGETAQTIGPYHLLQKIGEGGMGEVWVAEQHKPIHRRVALKLMKAGMDTKQVIARFESERQALAMMDHPVIAKVFDAGETAKGRPYFIMEYVQGIPITTHCDQNRLTTRERLELFNRVCDGVQHAHQKAIIHRDLKPSNILVAIQDGKAVPKIIDFGVAKVTAHTLTERTMYTELGMLIGTPEYMSPEQAEMSGQDIDTRTDVYSLGAILYELLVGALPLDSKELRRAGFNEVRRKIREEDPPKPSTRLSTMGEALATQAQNRRTERPALIRQIRGDLDCITMRALEKDRTRRYGSPADFAADIERYLHHQPIIARPPSTVYKTKKFVRRHRIGVGVAASLAVLFVAFSGTTAIQARRIALERDRANQEAVISKQISEFLTGLFKISDPSEARGSSITAREILDKAADEIKKTLKDQPRIQARLMATIGGVFSSLGLNRKAESLLEEALRAQRHILGDDHPDTLISIYGLAQVYWWEKKSDEAEALYRELMNICKRIYGEENPETLRAGFELASAYYSQGRFEEMENLSLKVLKGQLRVLGEDHPDTLSTMNNLASLYYKQERYDDAVPINTRVLEVRRRVLGEDHPLTLRSMHNLATVYDKLGRDLLAEPLYMKVIEIERRVEGEGHPSTINSEYCLADFYYKLKRFEEAEDLLEIALVELDTSQGDQHMKLYEKIVRKFLDLYQDWGKPEKAIEYRRLLKSKQEE